MKAQRRHELEHNELADWLASVVTTVKPYRKPILFAVLLIAVVLLLHVLQRKGVIMGLWTHSPAATTQAWDQFYEAMTSNNPSKLREVIEKHPNTDVAHYAGAVLGDVYLNYGCNLLFVSKASANQELRKAAEQYLTVLGQSRNPMLRQRATFGLARANESLGELEQARQRYEEVCKNWPSGAYTAVAEARLRDLKKPATLAMYDRFAKFDPRPAFLDEPGLTPGKRPPFDLDSMKEEGPVFQPPGKAGPKPGAVQPPEEPEEQPLQFPKPKAGKPETEPAEPPPLGPKPAKPAAEPDGAEPPSEPDAKQ